MADPTTENIVNKLTETLGLIHNDLEDVKQILNKNGIQATGTTKTLAEDITKLPKQVEDNIKNSTELTGMAGGTLDIHTGFVYSPNTTGRLTEDNCIFAQNVKDFVLPGNKELKMFFPNDTIVNNMIMSEVNKANRNLSLTLNDSAIFYPENMKYLTGAKKIDSINFTVKVKDTTVKTIIENGKEYFDFTNQQKPPSGPPMGAPGYTPGSNGYSGDFALADYNTKFIVNDKVVENVKCSTFYLSPNAYVKEVVADHLYIDYALIKNILYKDDYSLSTRTEDYNDDRQFNPIKVKIKNFLNADRVGTRNEQESDIIDQPPFIKNVDPYKVDDTYNVQAEQYLTKAKSYGGFNTPFAKLLNKYFHILVDHTQFNTNNQDMYALQLPLYSLDETKKFNYAKHKWEDVNALTEDKEVFSPLRDCKMIGYSLKAAVTKTLPRDSQQYDNKGIITLDGYSSKFYNGVSTKNSYFAPTKDGYYCVRSGLLEDTDLDTEYKYSNNETITFELKSRDTFHGSPFANLIQMSYSKDKLNIVFNRDQLTYSNGYLDPGDHISLFPTHWSVKFHVNSTISDQANSDLMLKREDNITKLDCRSSNLICPLFFNKTVEEVLVNKIYIPFRLPIFRRLVVNNQRNSYYYGPVQETGFTKFVFGDNPEIINYAQYAYNAYDEGFGNNEIVKNHKGYRFDSTHQQEIDNFVKNMHVYIKSNHPKMNDKEFLMYRLPLFTLDGRQRYNYSLKKWQLLEQYDPKNDATPMEQIYPELKDKLAELWVIGDTINTEAHAGSRPG